MFPMIAFVGDSVKITLSTGIDLAGHTQILIKYEKPDGTTGSWTPILSGSESMEFNTITSTLDQRGTWRLQTFVAFGVARLHGLWVEMKVYAPIY